MTKPSRPPTRSGHTPIKVTDKDCCCLLAILGVDAYKTPNGLSNRDLLAMHIARELSIAESFLPAEINAINQIPNERKGFDIRIDYHEPITFPYLHASQLALDYYIDAKTIPNIAMQYVTEHDPSTKGMDANLQLSSTMMQNDLLLMARNGLTIAQPPKKSLFKKMMWQMLHLFTKTPTPEEEAQKLAGFVNDTLMRASVKPNDKDTVIATGEAFANKIQRLMIVHPR